MFDLDGATEQLDAIFVEHSHYQAAYRKVRVGLSLAGTAAEAPCIQLSGPTGTGKTTIRRMLNREFPRIKSQRTIRLPRTPPVVCDDVPLLAFRMPENPTVLSLVRAALLAFKDPDWHRNDAFMLTHRLDTFIQACGTKAIIIDEAHLAVDRDGVVATSHIAEWLTGRHSENSIALVLMGMGRVKYLFDADLHLERRWDDELRLEGYRWMKKVGHSYPERDTFMDILEAFATLSPVPFASDVDVSDPVTAYRFAYATRGIIGLLKKLLHQCLRILAEDGVPPLITNALLERACNAALRGSLKPPENPFSKDFVPSLATEPPPLVDDSLLLPPSGRRRQVKRKRASEDQLRSTFRKRR